MAEGAVATARRLNDICNADRQVIQGLGRKAGSALRIHQVFQGRPIASIPFLSKMTKMSPPTIAAALDSLQRAKIVKEVTGRKRKRIYVYQKYLDLMNKGTEP
jgi:Fic family protein